MFKKTAWASVVLSLVAIPTLGAISFGAAPAEAAVVYCKTAGVPQGCVVRPTPVVVAPVAGAAVVTPGAPVARAVATPGAPVARAAAAPGVGRVGPRR